MTNTKPDKQYCWEFIRCGKIETKDCPAIKQNMGKFCWLVAGTMCGGDVHGTHARELGSCKKCEYYKYIND